MMTTLTAMHVHLEPAYRAGPAPRTGHSQRRLAAQLCNAFLAWADRLQDRATLSRLDDRLLADIGLTRYDVETLLSRRGVSR